MVQNLQNIVNITRHDVGLHTGAAAKQLIINLAIGCSGEQPYIMFFSR